MKLYTTPHSTASERVRLALLLKGLEFTEITATDMDRVHYLGVNPSGLVPALALNGQIIAQSNAILHFLEATFPQKPLLPDDPFLRANALALAQHITSEMHAIDVTRIRRFLKEQMGLNDRDLGRWSHHWFAEGFRVLEETLARRAKATTYCFGDDPGWADLHLVPHVRKAVERFQVDMTPYPNIRAVYDRCKVLPEFIEARAKLAGG